MFDLRRAPVQKVLIPYAAGSLAGYLMGHSPAVMALLIPGLVGWLILLMLHVHGCSSGRMSAVLFATIALFLFLLLGFGTGMLTRPADPGLPVGEKVLIGGLVLEDPCRRQSGWTLEMRINQVTTMAESCGADTRLMVYFEMPADSVLPAAGETWVFYGVLARIRNSGNPGDVDYEAIMQRKNCWYRFYPDRKHSFAGKVTGHRRGNLSAAQIRKALSERWKGDPEVIALLKAICLGDRSGLTDDLRQSYSDAGGMHLLALSGLHVGLIWWTLQHALAWLVRLLKKEAYRSAIIVVLLWYYALITGFSTSVCRSVIMFTLFTLARLIDQRTQPVNCILLSAFLLISLDPGKMLDVGFQLSYAAVLGIIAFFPVLRNIWKVKSRMLKWIWEATAISIAAQLSTAPLVVFYFHKLPVYSILTNLLAIPLLSILITIFVISIPFMSAGIFTGIFNSMMIHLGGILNKSMDLVASIPGAVVGELSLHPVNLILVMLLISMGMSLTAGPSSYKTYGILIIASLLLLWNSWTRYRNACTSELLVAHFRDCSAVTFRAGIAVDHYCWCRDSLSESYMERYLAMKWPYRSYSRQTLGLNDSGPVFGQISGAIPVAPGILVIGNDHRDGYLLRSGAKLDDPDFLFSQPADFLLLSCEPGLPDSALFRFPTGCDLIADGSNRSSYLDQLGQAMVSVHRTRFDGAYCKQW